MPLMVLIITLIGDIRIYAITYCIMAIHELAHLTVSILIGLKPDYILFSAFGVNLKLKCKIINSVADEIILYGIGPLINALFALVALYLNNILLYRINISLFILNLLPILPLDGGMIALRLLSRRIGLIASKRILNAFSWCVALIISIIALIGIYYGEINISVYIILMFIIGNILTSTEKYNPDLINCISNKKFSNNTKVTVVSEDYGLIETIKKFSPSYTTVAIFVDNDGKIKEIASESQIIEKYQQHST